MTDLAPTSTPPTVEVLPPKPQEEFTPQEKVFAQINPCPVCGRNQHEAPEGDARTALHCFRCGYAPGQRVNATLISPQQLDTQHLLEQLRAGVVSDLLKAFAEAGLAVPTPSTVRPPSVQIDPSAPAAGDI